MKLLCLAFKILYLNHYQYTVSLLQLHVFLLELHVFIFILSSDLRNHVLLEEEMT